jgi:hypothetical protein
MQADLVKRELDEAVPRVLLSFLKYLTSLPDVDGQKANL